MKIAERIEGHYEVPNGGAHGWRPERVVLECKCGERVYYKRTMLLGSVVRCECGKDHSVSIREDLVLEVLEDNEILHPWRHWRAPEKEALPF